MDGGAVGGGSAAPTVGGSEGFCASRDVAGPP
jgi:hypothetical protein